MSKKPKAAKRSRPKKPKTTKQSRIKTLIRLLADVSAAIAHMDKTAKIGKFLVLRSEYLTQSAAMFSAQAREVARELDVTKESVEHAEDTVHQLHERFSAVAELIDKTTTRKFYKRRARMSAKRGKRK